MSGCKDCAKYEKQVEGLMEELALIKFELEELRTKRYKPKKKPPTDDEPKLEPKKKGGLFGHQGWFRKKPRKINKIVEVELTTCPECGGKDIKEYADITEHYQEDIVLPKVETTLFRKHTDYCKKCQKVITGKGKNELANSYIGPIAKAFAIFLKYRIKVVDRDIQKMFEQMFNLKVVPSSIVGFRDQLKREAADIYRKLIEGLKKGKFMHIDETGTRLNGKNAWRWKFSNKKICITHTDESRRQKVVEKILGENYLGILITDFLSAYNKIITKAKQRCLIHLLRDLTKVIRYWQDDREVLNYCKRLKQILEDAIELYKEYKNQHWDNKYISARERIVEQLQDFSFPNPRKKILHRFVKRLNRHKNELFPDFIYGMRKTKIQKA
ncbi:MAG: transposase [bacterium]